MGQLPVSAVEKKVSKNPVSRSDAVFFCRRSRLNPDHVPGVVATAHTPCRNVSGRLNRLRSRGKSSSARSETDRITQNGMPCRAAIDPIAALSMSRLLASKALPMASLSLASQTIFPTVTKRPERTAFSDNCAVLKACCRYEALQTIEESGTEPVRLESAQTTCSGSTTLPICEGTKAPANPDEINTVQGLFGYTASHAARAFTNPIPVRMTATKREASAHRRHLTPLIRSTWLAGNARPMALNSQGVAAKTAMFSRKDSGNR